MTADTPDAFVNSLHRAWFSEPDIAKAAPHVLLRAVLKMTARGRAIGDEFLERAEAGDPDADAMLCWEAADYLMRGEPLPEPLAYFVSDTLLQKILSSESKRDHKNVARNIFAIHAIDQVRKRFNLHATRQRLKHHSPRDPSACTYVAAALRENEGTIQDLWEKRRRKYGVFD